MDNITDIVKKHMCMSCGGCSYICPRNAIFMKYDKKKGFFFPSIVHSLCTNCGACRKICPALHQENTAPMGEYSNIKLAYSLDSKVRTLATSGGVINSLIRFCITNEIYEAAVLVGYSASSIIEAESMIITKSNVEIMASFPRDFASRYVTVPVLDLLGEALSKYKKIILVGTSCQICALNLITPYLSGDHHIFTVGITCSSGLSYNATLEYKRREKMLSAKMFYRGEGWPGKNTLISKDIQREFKHFGSLFEKMYSSQIFKNPACKYCKDHFAEKADISFCDFWDSDEIKHETLGNSAVIIRSVDAYRIFSQMEQEKCIKVKRDLEGNELLNTQSHVVNVKKSLLRNHPYYRIFYAITSFIFTFKIYRLFGKKIYNLFSVAWWRISGKT